MPFENDRDRDTVAEYRPDSMQVRERQIIKEAALRLLASREHSRYELKTKLLVRAKKYNIPATQLDPVLDQLIEEGLLDERRFAKSYTRLSLEKGWGKIKITHYLRKKGVSDDHIQACLTEHDDLFWTQQACALLKRKYGKVADDPADRAGQQRFLAGRGFSYDQIRNAMEEVAAGGEAEQL